MLHKQLIKRRKVMDSILREEKDQWWDLNQLARFEWMGSI